MSCLLGFLKLLSLSDDDTIAFPTIPPSIMLNWQVWVIELKWVIAYTEVSILIKSCCAYCKGRWWNCRKRINISKRGLVVQLNQELNRRWRSRHNFKSIVIVLIHNTNVQQKMVPNTSNLYYRTSRRRGGSSWRPVCKQ